MDFNSATEKNKIDSKKLVWRDKNSWRRMKPMDQLHFIDEDFIIIEKKFLKKKISLNQNQREKRSKQSYIPACREQHTSQFASQWKQKVEKRSQMLILPQVLPSMPCATDTDNRVHKNPGIYKKNPKKQKIVSILATCSSIRGPTHFAEQ